ncbi:AAA family ATPase [Duganella sp. BuS-21]|uniref:AAA family ATPase n=1 Tax=Duganella sp. BuS-21 TaxID=2943848 RepID=UPI0035A718AD
MTVIGLLNQKGGVGKTTLAIALAACYALMGYRALLAPMRSWWGEGARQYLQSPQKNGLN